MNTSLQPLCKNFFTCETLDAIQKLNIDAKEIVRRFIITCNKCEKREEVK